ncbi:MAG: glycosyltransferase family 9 protein [Lautropia sp.]
MQPEPSPPGPPPLVVRFGAMGDLVLILPMIRELARRHGTPVDVLCNGGWARPLLAGQPGVGTVHLLARRGLPYLLSAEQRALVAQLRAIGPRPAWHCDTDDRCIALLARAGIAAPALRRASQLPIADGEHLIDYWLRFGRDGDGAAEVGDPRLVVDPAEAAALPAWLAARGIAGRRLVLIQPGNKRTMRRGLRRRPSNTKWWPEANWARVVRAVAERDPGAAILLLGVQQEAGLNDEILALAGVAAARNIATDLPLPRLLALQAVASSMISVDTGPAHSAAALGCPVVVLFGVADPVRIRPRGDATPVTVLTGTIDGQPAMTGIGAADVIAAWDALPKR